MKQHKIGFLLCIIFITCIHSQHLHASALLEDPQTDFVEYANHFQRTKVSRGLVDAGVDVLKLYRNLFDWDTYKIFVSFFPFYIAASMADRSLRNMFYDRTHHRNINQIHGHLQKFANDFSVGTVAAIAGMSWLCSSNPVLVETSRMFLVGVPFVILTTDFIKLAIQTRISLRPWHERFSCTHRAYGGFPSTHGAQLGYATALFAKQMGISLGLPFGLLTTFVGLTFINGNRHTLAQYIAGIGLGTMFAYAADKIVNKRVAKDWELNLNIDAKLGPCLDLGIQF